jgi:hypothetical protein
MRVMTQREDLTESLRHLEYEIAMIVAAPRMLAQHQLTPALNIARPDGYFWANDRAVAYLAAMESTLTHARVLDDFFKPASGALPTRPPAKANDRYAAEYCETNGWKGFAVLTKDEHDAIDKQLSHLSTQRAPRKTHALGQFSRKAVDALILLTRRADPQWQPRLQDILDKTDDERRRADDAWDPN